MVQIKAIDNESYDVIVEESDSDDGQSVQIDVRYQSIIYSKYLL